MPHLLTLVTACISAAEAWEDLKVLYEDDISSRRDELETDLTVLSRQAGESMIKYIGRAKGLRDALVTAGVQVTEHSLALHMLRGLPSGYKTMRQVLRGMGELHGGLRLAGVTVKLLYAEKELAAEDNGGTSTTPAAFAVAEDNKRQAAAAAAAVAKK